MTSVRPLSKEDLADMKPKYVGLPTNWEAAGVQTKTDKRGKEYTLISYVGDEGVVYSFFSDKVVKDDAGNILIELRHFNSQLERAKAWAAKGGKA